MPLPYKVVRPGEPDREFERSREAMLFVVQTPGVSELYGPFGLILTKGVLSSRGGMREEVEC